MDKGRDIGVFSVANAWILTADYAGNSLYQTLTDGEINRAQFDVLDYSSTIDNVSSCISLAGTVMILLVIILLLTQKKRLAKKIIDHTREKKRLIRRCIVLIPLLILIPLLPRILVYVAGYGFASYKMIGVWFPYSFLIAFGVLEVMQFLMLVSGVTRFIQQKHQTNE